MGHELGGPADGLFDPVFALPLAVVGAVEPDMAPPRKLPRDRVVEHELHAVAVHDVRWMNHGAQHEAVGIHEQMPLASVCLP